MKARVYQKTNYDLNILTSSLNVPGANYSYIIELSLTLSEKARSDKEAGQALGSYL